MSPPPIHARHGVSISGTLPPSRRPCRATSLAPPSSTRHCPRPSALRSPPSSALWRGSRTTKGDPTNNGASNAIARDTFDLPFGAFVTEASRRFGVPAAWIAPSCRGEFGAVHAVSPKGAIGLMQIMPATWAGLRQPTVSAPIPTTRTTTSSPARPICASCTIATALAASSRPTTQVQRAGKITSRPAGRCRWRRRRILPASRPIVGGRCARRCAPTRFRRPCLDRCVAFVAHSIGSLIGGQPRTEGAFAASDDRPSA